MTLNTCSKRASQRAHHPTLHAESNPERGRRIVDPTEVYYLETQDEDAWVWLSSARPLVDLRPFRELVPLFAIRGLLQIHR